MIQMTAIFNNRMQIINESTAFKKQNSGFSFLELMVVISLIGIISAIAVPGILGYRDGTRMRSATNDIHSNLQRAKSIAIRENTWVLLEFAENTYTICLDGDNDTLPNEICDDDEKVIGDAGMVPGVQIDIANSDFNGNDSIRFDRRGLPVLGAAANGTLELTDTMGHKARITVNRLGFITTTTSEDGGTTWQ